MRLNNRHKLFSTVTLMTLLVISIGGSSFAYAQTNFGVANDLGVDFGFRLQMAFEDFREFITFDPLIKAQVKAQHSINAQDKLQELIDNDEPVPDEVVQRIDTKIIEARAIVADHENEFLLQLESDPQESFTTQSIDALKDSFDKVESAGDVLKVRALVVEFDQLKEDFDNGEITEDQARVLSERLDNEANSNDLINENCETELDTFSLLMSDDPDQKITDFCSSLKDVDLVEARHKLLLFE